MGAWGSGSFENDDACDFADDLTDGGAEAMRSALEEVGDADDDQYLEAPECSNAVAAAEVVAAARDGAVDGLPDEIAAWLSAHAKVLGADDVALARRAVARVLARSELQELWDESGADNAWRVTVGKLLARLG